MKSKLLAVLAFIVLALGGTGYDMFFNQPQMVKTTQKPTTPTNLQPMPEFNITNFAKEPFALNDFKEDILILNFWAAWCSTCIAEIPDMLNLAQEYGSKVALVTVSIDNKSVAPQKFISRWQKQYPQQMQLPNIYWLWDEKKQLSLKQLNLIKVPETIIINKNRMMADKIIGEYNWAGDKIRAKINKLLHQQ